MKNISYYELLISDSLDRELSTDEMKELTEAKNVYKELVDFEKLLKTDRNLLSSLPEIQPIRQYGWNAKHSSNRLSTFRNFWSSRLSIPTPVAALVVVLLVVSFLINAYSNYLEPNTEVTNTVIESNYVNVIRLQPAYAVQIKP